MPQKKLQKKHLIKACTCRKAVIQKELMKNNSQRIYQISQITETFNKLNDEEFNKIFQYINNLNKPQIGITKKRRNLIKHIELLPDIQISDVYNLLKTMVYPKGKDIGKILSSYLQKKACDFISTGIYKQEFSATAILNTTKNLQKQVNKLEKNANVSAIKIDSFSKCLGKAHQAKALYISKIKSAIQNAKKVTSNQYQKVTKQLFKINNKEYAAKFVKLATDISLIRHTSISATIECVTTRYKTM
ncbi:17007_t:CDS:1 [Dentiscutata erythropus]|uniref:17007_t:CDS:1 n=1 Tax=Dentiscutata erythropus TaxID=1348616 RepID=A0A9N9N8Z7_9GLOM|nr:17007_t:CDS:1 [Dentiscutata erythropus]